MVKFPDPDLQLFENLPFKVVVIDRGYQVVYANKSPDILVGQKCHEVLWDSPEVCDDCQVRRLFDQGVPFKKAGQGQFCGQKAFMTCEYRLLHNHAVCFLDDKTQMVSALKGAKENAEKIRSEMDQHVEKAKAQQRMLRHKLSNTERKLTQIPQIMEGVSAGVMMIDSGKQVLHHNARLNSVLMAFYNPDTKKRHTCYEMLYRRDEACEDCPISKGRLLQHRLTRKMEGGAGSGYMTEEFSKAGKDFVLTVTNSSRTIELAMSIQSHLSELEEINRILNSIVRRGAALQNSDDLESLFELVLDELANYLFPEKETPMVLLSKQTPSRNVEQAVFRNVAPEDRKEFLRLFAESTMAGLESLGWQVFPLSGSFSGGTGFFMVQSPILEEKRLSILKIFLNMVGSRLDNLKLVANLERQAHIDGLTGTFNRAFFEKRFEQEKEKADKVGLNFGIVVIDINGLKRINDVYGHLAGDTLIQACGSLLKKNIRESDVLSRFGGDEYVILLPSTGIEGVLVLVDRINTAQKDATYCFPGENGDKIVEPLQMSVGAASSEETPIDKVFNLADERMYEAKERFYETHERYR